MVHSYFIISLFVEKMKYFIIPIEMLGLYSRKAVPFLLNMLKKKKVNACVLGVIQFSL